MIQQNYNISTSASLSYLSTELEDIIFLSTELEDIIFLSWDSILEPGRAGVRSLTVATVAMHILEGGGRQVSDR